MINYHDEYILNKSVFNCLSFDPFTLKETNPEKAKEGNLLNKRALQLVIICFIKEYYTCAENCVILVKTLPLVTYNYHQSCFCIKSCYEALLKSTSA